MSERIPLAPRAEQQRIVERLERLFVEVDRSKSRMAKIPVLLKRFHQSVLAAACSGRITADWRDFRDRMPRTEVVFRQIRERRLKAASSIKQRQVIEDIYSAVEENDSDMLPQGWAFTYLNKLAESFDYGTSTKSSNEGTVPVLRMGNIQGGTIDWSDLVYTSDEEEIEKYALEPNTVLFNRTNSPELVGKTALYRGERPALFAGYLIRVNAVPELDPEYLNLCLNSPAAREFCSQVKTDGVSQSNINAQKLGTFEVPFCSLAEQQEIVRRVAKLFALANRIESRYDAAKKRIDPLTQSILAKAFRGELVPTEAALAEAEGRSFESAEELLNMIRRRDSTAEKPRLVRSSGRGH
jgi:type I restriction enzyme S subunit